MQLAAEGFWLFPIVAGQKVPPKGMHFKEQATRGQSQLAAWFDGPGPYDIGIYTGRFSDDQALLIVDVDKKPDKNGEWTILEEGYLFPITRTHRSPSGGRHLIYKTPEAVKQGANVLGPGLDIRSRGGYVVAYKGDLCAVADAPTWLVDRCGQAAKVKDPVIERATAFLQEHPPAIEGQGGDSHTYKTACRLKDFGVPRLMAWDLMVEHWNDRCEPPWELNDLRQKVDNAYGYGVEPPGVADPRQDFTVWTDETPDGCYAIREAGAIVARVDEEWLIDEVLPLRGLAVLYAAPGRKKSFTAIDMGMAVARGVPWHMKVVEPGAVLYIDADGNIDNRVAAYCQHHQLDRASIPFGAVSDAPNLWGSNVDVEKVVRTIETWGRKPVRMLVVDTVARVLGGGDENSGQAMGALLANIGRIQRACRVAVLLVHHIGKDASKGARGHSSLIAAVDTALEIIDGDVIHIFKQRDGQDGERFGFQAKPIDLGPNKRGRMVRSLVLEPKPVGTAAQDFKLPPGAQIALTALENLGLTPGQKVRLDEWAEDFGRLYDLKQEKKADTIEKAFGRAKRALTGRIAFDKAFAWVVT